MMYNNINTDVLRGNSQETKKIMWEVDKLQTSKLIEENKFLRVRWVS